MSFFCRTCPEPKMPGFLYCEQCWLTRGTAKLTEKTKEIVIKKRREELELEKRAREIYQLASTKHTKTKARNKLIILLMDIVLAQDKLLEFDQAGNIVFYEDNREAAVNLKKQIPYVMEKVAKSYQNVEVLYAPSLLECRKQAGLHPKGKTYRRPNSRKNET